MSRLKQLIFGTYNCDCDQSRKDEYHNWECSSHKNGWFPEKWKRENLK